MLSLLSTSLIRAVVDGRQELLTLPETVAALMRDAVDTFPAMRPHQVPAWHMLVCTLCALALHRAGEREAPDDAATWADLFRELTDGAEEPWSLVVADLSKPAFLQPPVPEKATAAFKNTIPTADALDVLITAKTFDIKPAVASTAEPDDWLFALISLQTMEGYLGAGNFGIARMNGGFSARTFLGLAPPGGVGAHIRRDIRAMLAERESLLENYRFYDEDGLALLWLEPWDGGTSLPLSRLDPWFIEICRRIRFIPEGTGFSVRSVGTAAPRIDAKALKGVTGDFWAPVNQTEVKAFSLDARGFSYRVLCRLLFEDKSKSSFSLPPSLKPHPGEDDMRLVARGITRGQGKTEGFHERIVPLQRTVRYGFADPDRRRALGELADLQQREIAQIATALRFACATVANGGAQEKPGKDDYASAEPYVARLEATADADFFVTLQSRYENGEEARVPYLRHLIDQASSLVTQASESIPCASRQRWRARVSAPRAFFGTLWRGVLVNDRDLIRTGTETADD